MSRPHNPIAVAMRRRYGRTTSVYHDKRKERGGDRNESRDLLDELGADDEEDSDDAAEAVAPSASG